MGFAPDSLGRRPGNSVIEEWELDGALPSGRRSVVLPCCETGVPV